MDKNLEELHNKTSKLNSDEIILLIMTLDLNGKYQGQIKKIMKMYLCRALLREGIK